jgi:5S rRNA maturation endonuclease (ribonuclease M5)
VNATESEIIKLQNLIDLLNSKKDSIVVVEGKRDASALKKLGFSGKICEFHSFKGLARFADSVTSYKNLILLFDGDSKGKYLTSKIISQLEHRIRIDLSFKRKLVTITKGKIRHIEDLSRYTRQDQFTVI